MTDLKRPEFIVGRLVRQFLGYSGELGEQTRVFADLPEELQKRLAAEAQFEANELGAIAYYKSETEWVILTDRRIAWRNQEGSGSVHPRDVKDITRDIAYMKKVGGKPLLDRLDIILNDGSTQYLFLEPESLYGFWNASLTLKSLRSGRSSGRGDN